MDEGQELQFKQIAAAAAQGLKAAMRGSPRFTMLEPVEAENLDAIAALLGQIVAAHPMHETTSARLDRWHALRKLLPPARHIPSDVARANAARIAAGGE